MNRFDEMLKIESHILSLFHIYKMERSMVSNEISFKYSKYVGMTVHTTDKGHAGAPDVAIGSLEAIHGFLENFPSRES